MKASIGYKQQLYAQLARIGQAVSHGNRLEMLEYLAQCERSVEALARLCSLSVANTSRHLQVLKHAGLVTARKEGVTVYYRVADAAVLALLDALRWTAESRWAEIERLLNSYLKARDELESVQPPDLLDRMREGLVTVVDVRPPEEFAAGHLPGAINIPIQEFEERLPELPRFREIVAYCRGPYCVMAYEAVVTARRKGYQARRMKDGFPEWQLAGLPVERGSARA